MKRMLQLFILAAAMGLLFGGSKPVEAQRFTFSGSEFGSNDLYRPRIRSSRRKIKRSRQRVKRKKTASIGRIRRKQKRRSRRVSKRKVASLKKSVVSIKKKKITPSKAVKGPVQIVVSLARQRVNIYKGGNVIASARVSTGRSGHRTPTGVFSIIQKHKTHFSNLYDNAPMPFMQRITWSGIALHAGNVSRPYQSHGCIRMPYGFAKKLFKSTRMGAHVIVASGSSSLTPISHQSLIQPLPIGSTISKEGVRTAGLSTGATGQGEASMIETGGLPGFVKPVVAAQRHLAQKERDYQQALAAGPGVALAFEQANINYKEQKSRFIKAKKITLASKKQLRKPRYALSLIKRRRAPRLRALKKAERRAKWAWDIIDKRRDNPKFEGKWTDMALARAQSRDAKVQKAKLKLEEVTLRLDAATVEYDLLLDANQQARTAVSKFAGELKKAGLLLKKAQSDVAANKRLVLAEKKNVKIAVAGVKKAKAREKLPLRILITPRTGKERVKTAQRLLTKIGYTPGIADGAVGKNTRAAINAFQRERNVPETGKVSDKLMEALFARVGRPQTNSAHMYVRQGFLDLFDVPVDIVDPAKPLGTHVYTAMHFDTGASTAQWTALTVKNTAHKSLKKRKGKKARKRVKTPLARVNAQQALDRIKLPDAVRRQLSMLLTPGSSMVVSDKGASHETGRGTDFVVLTK